VHIRCPTRGPNAFIINFRRKTTVSYFQFVCGEDIILHIATLSASTSRLAGISVASITFGLTLRRALGSEVGAS
jgi:hypothetical protein